jgi:hypothetical protein
MDFLYIAIWIMWIWGELSVWHIMSKRLNLPVLWDLLQSCIDSIEVKRSIDDGNFLSWMSTDIFNYGFIALIENSMEDCRSLSSHNMRLEVIRAPQNTICKSTEYTTEKFLISRWECINSSWEFCLYIQYLCWYGCSSCHRICVDDVLDNSIHGEINRYYRSCRDVRVESWIILSF